MVLEANQSNEFAPFINDLAKNLSLGLDPFFTPDNPKVGVLLNYGLAAALYSGAGQLVARLLR